MRVTLPVPVLPLLTLAAGVLAAVIVSCARAAPSPAEGGPPPPKRMVVLRGPQPAAPSDAQSAGGPSPGAQATGPQGSGAQASGAKPGAAKTRAAALVAPPGPIGAATAAPIASAIPADPSQCRLDCAQAYYFCAAADDPDSCSGAWVSCLIRCSPSTLPAADAGG